MNKTNKILLVMAILLFVVSPVIAERANGQLFTLGNADRTYDYKSTTITCYLGQLFPGQPIYWCMYPDGSMDHSWFVYQNREMDAYYTMGGISTTLTYSGK